MDMDELVKKYVNAWNQFDVPGLLDLMHPGAAFYDAFWAETCVGCDLALYFRDAMEEEPFWFEVIGDTIPTENGVVFRFSAHHRSGSTMGEPVHFGAEILNVREGKILTVTSIYCSAEQSQLREVAELATQRHGLSSHTDSGLGALKKARIKDGLSVSFEEDKVYLDPDITMSQLADKIGCTLDQLSIVIENQFESDFKELLDAQRIEHAKGLLEIDPDCWPVLSRAASLAGFKSTTEFSRRFADIVGVTPVEFCDQQRQLKVPQDHSRLH